MDEKIKKYCIADNLLLILIFFTAYFIFENL